VDEAISGLEDDTLNSAVISLLRGYETLKLRGSDYLPFSISIERTSLTLDFANHYDFRASLISRNVITNLISLD
jgi:hypothetical protein